MNSAEQVISTLKDVPGVQGSFLVSSRGELVARDMASLFTNDLLADVAPRVMRLTETFAADDAEVHSCVIRYPHYMLFLRGAGSHSLCVFATRHVNMPALKMGVTLAVRRLTVLFESPQSAVMQTHAQPQPTSPRATMPEIPIAAAPESVSEPRPTMRWRGRAVSEGE